MENRLSAADYDVDRGISECITGNSVATERSYAVVLRSYCVFHGIEVDSCFAIDFTDTKVAVYWRTLVYDDCIHVLPRKPIAPLSELPS